MIKDEREIGRSITISKNNYAGDVYNMCITVTYRGELQGLKITMIISPIAYKQ